MSTAAEPPPNAAPQPLHPPATGGDTAEHEARCSLEHVLITAELASRPARAPDYSAESRALSALAQEMTSSPATVQQRLVEWVLELCHADSAGISLLEPGGQHGIFRWTAVAGGFAANLHGTMPREASPCGVVFEQDDVLLFNGPEQVFPELLNAEPTIYEGLLAPFHVDGKPVGTVWALKHSSDGRFDAEDARLLRSLSCFASAAHQMVSALEAARANETQLVRRVEERNAALRESEALLAGQKEAFEAAVDGRPLAEALGILHNTAVKHAGEGGRCGFYLANHATKQLWHVVGMSDAFRECGNGVPIGPDEPGCGLAVHSGEPVITPDALASERWNTWRWLPEKFHFRGVWSFPLKAKGGHVLGTFAMYFKGERDATPRDHAFCSVIAKAAAIIISRHQQAQERERAEAALREADRRKDEFLAVLAHELRNPLAPIRNAVQILKSPALNGTQRDWSREVIDRQVQQMARLLDDLLDVSRITRGKIELRKETVILQSAIDLAVETARPLLDARAQQLQTELPAEPITMNADPARITQILGNLLNNAAKYTYQGGLIRLIAEVEGAEVVLRIQDNGIGMTPEQLSHLFEMFTQAPEAFERSEGGLGIGLSLTKGFVELHGGSIAAHSEGQGKGSEFIVRLPLGGATAGN